VALAVFFGWQGMWIEKLTDGVLALDTPIGPRYVQPSFMQRLHLMWTFRNFCSLSPLVLRPVERRLIDRLWSENRFVSLSGERAQERPVIGRIERRQPVEAGVLPSREALVRQPNSGASRPTVAEPSREASSA
jgi:hypothetical protein